VKSSLVSTNSLLALGCALSFGVLASSPATAQGGPPTEPPGQGGGGGGGGGGPGGGGGGGPGGGGGGGGKGDLYADLIVILRDTEGLPIFTEVPTAEGSVNCLQPISAAPVDGLIEVKNDADNKQVSLIPLGGTGVEGEECDVDPDYAYLVQEVLFGRLNLGRSPTRVLSQQLRDVTGVLASSVEQVEIDEAGRFVAYVPVATEIDSPGNNLAIHKELQVEGELRDQTQTLILLPEPANDGVLDHAAAALGAAAGKGDVISLDLVVYNNRILNIPNETAETDFLPTLTGDGDVGEAGERYINYTGAGYGYTRSDTFPGCVRGLLTDFPDAGDFTPFSGTIMDCVFGTITFDGTNGVCADGVDFTGATAVHRFAQRADDARAVIAFVHDNAVADSTAILPAEQAGVDQAGGSLVCDDIEGP
jgi:hypothetical protein